MVTTRKCCKFFSRGMVLVLFWSALISTITLSFKIKLVKLLPLSKDLKHIISYAHFGLLVLLPIAGWISDSLLGRYRAITVGLTSITFSFLVLLITFVMLQFNWTPIPTIVILNNIFWDRQFLHKCTAIHNRSNDRSLSRKPWYHSQLHWWAFALGALAQCLIVIFSYQTTLPDVPP